jgi:hypothetical protein
MEEVFQHKDGRGWVRVLSESTWIEGLSDMDKASLEELISPPPMGGLARNCVRVETSEKG